VAGCQVREDRQPSRQLLVNPLSRLLTRGWPGAYDVLPVLAKQRGRTASEARDEFRAGSDEGKQTFSEAVAQSIDQMVASKYEREVAELKKKIRELESRGERQ
jgi:hypothetical protein